MSNPISNQSYTPEGYTGPALGNPIGGGGHSAVDSATSALHSHSATGHSSSATGAGVGHGGAALAGGSAGDYTPNPFGSTVQGSGAHGTHSHSHPHSSSDSAAALKGAAGGSGGEGRDTSYETTHPQSGFQAQGEAQPHVAGRGGAAAAGLSGAAIGSGAGALGGSHSHGHAGENATRRDEGLVNQAEHGVTGQGLVQSNQASTHGTAATLDRQGDFVSGSTGPHSTGAGVAGLAGAGGLAAGAGAGGLAGASHHSGVNPGTKNNTSGGPEDLTIGGFNPKVAASGIDPSVPSGKDVEHISTDGPHGLVMVDGKYVHRREL